MNMKEVAMIDTYHKNKKALRISPKRIQALLLTLFISILMSCDKENTAPSSSSGSSVNATTSAVQKDVQEKQDLETPYEQLSPESDEKVLRYYLSDFSHHRKYSPSNKSITWKRSGEFTPQETDTDYTTRIEYTDTIGNQIYHILATESSAQSDKLFGSVIMKKNSSGVWECKKKVVKLTYAKEFQDLYRLNSRTIGYGFVKKGIRESHHTTDLLEVYTALKGNSKKVLTVHFRESWESENWAVLTGKLTFRNTLTNGYKEIHYTQTGMGYGPDGEWTERYYDEYCSFNGDMYECSH